MVLLRGFLYISLNEAQDLPDTDTAFFNIDSELYGLCKINMEFVKLNTD